MKFLFISDNAIYGFGGGCVENHKHYDALKNYCQSKGHELKVISTDIGLEDALDLQIEKSKKIDMLVRLQGHSSFLYWVWKKNISCIKEYSPDVIFLGRSRFGFIAEYVKKNMPSCAVITNVDNVEWDYVESYFAEKKGIKGLLLKTIEKIVVFRDEKKAIKYSDKLIFLTQRNVDRYKKIYKYHHQKPSIIPICLGNEIKLDKISSTKTVIFIGSLDYAANVLAVKRLIQEIWSDDFESRSDLRLIIAGRKPTDEVKKLIQSVKNVTLISDFKAVQDIIPAGSLMLAPIEKGAGMKVKVAETLCMGCMIAASDEALVGYEKAVEADELNCVIRANKIEEYRAAISNYIGKTKEELDKIEEQNKKIFRTYYSYNLSRKEIEKICDLMCGVRHEI